MVKKEEVVKVLIDLDNELQTTQPQSELASYLHESRLEICKQEGVGFTGALQNFFDKAPVVKMASPIRFSARAQELWNQLFEFKQLGNNLWGLIF